jgi:cytoskeletal protein RodZ
LVHNWWQLIGSQKTVLPHPLSSVNDSSPSALLSLGQTLSQARQAEGLSVGALASRLNMGIEQLSALETGDLAKLPEPVFVIAQARRIAQNLGICIDAEIQALRQSEDFSPKAINLNALKLNPPTPGANDPSGASAPPATPGQRTQKPLKGHGALRALASVALAGGIAAGATALWQQWQTQQHQQRLQQLATARQAALVIQAKQRQAERLAQAAQASSLTLSSPEGSWLEVKTLNDQPLFRGDFKGRRGFSLHQGLKVLAGRPDRVEVQIGAAKSQPLGPISPVRWQTFAASKPPAATTTPTAAKTPDSSKPPAATQPPVATKPAAIAPKQTSQEKPAKPNGAAPATPSPDVPRAAPAP